jgi:cellulose synthase (UDP-forming)
VPQYHLELPVGLVRTSRLQQKHLLGLNFEMPARETQAALFLLLGSVVRAEPILRRS